MVERVRPFDDGDPSPAPEPDSGPGAALRWYAARQPDVPEAQEWARQLSRWADEVDTARKQAEWRHVELVRLRDQVADLEWQLRVARNDAELAEVTAERDLLARRWARVMEVLTEVHDDAESAPEPERPFYGYPTEGLLLLTQCALLHPNPLPAVGEAVQELRLRGVTDEQLFRDPLSVQGMGGVGSGEEEVERQEGDDLEQ